MSKIPQPMTLWRALGTVLSTGTAGALLGLGMGAAIGWQTPGYYTTVFPKAAKLPTFDPVQLGAGLGVTQGAGIGLVVGVVVVALLTWQYVRVSARGIR